MKQSLTSTQTKENIATKVTQLNELNRQYKLETMTKIIVLEPFSKTQIQTSIIHLIYQVWSSVDKRSWSYLVK